MTKTNSTSMMANVKVHPRQPGELQRRTYKGCIIEGSRSLKVYTDDLSRVYRTKELVLAIQYIEGYRSRQREIPDTPVFLGATGYYKESGKATSAA